MQRATEQVVGRSRFHDLSAVHDHYAVANTGEAVEVAPGVLSTDATAIVFELDPRRKKSSRPKKDRKKRDGTPPKPTAKDEKGTVEHPRLFCTPWRYIRAAHRDDGTDDFSGHPNRILHQTYFEKRTRREDEAGANRQRAEEQGGAERG